MSSAGNRRAGWVHVPPARTPNHASDAEDDESSRNNAAPRSAALLERITKRNQILADWVDQLEATSYLLMRIAAGIATIVAALVGILKLVGGA